MSRVLVIGGGPAGLAAAIHAAHGGRRVVIAERNDQCGVKLLATGGGHCNVSNTRPATEWPALFGRRGRFILPALNFMPLERLRQSFAALGVPLACPDGFHLFPESNSARQVRDALMARAAELGVRVECGQRLKDLAEARQAGDAIVIATGGVSYPATGSTGDGWPLAETLGHKIKPAFPGLVGLRTDNLSPELAGLVLSDAKVFFKAHGKRVASGEGELLLTHGGVSGPAILDLSASVAEAIGESGGGVPLRIQWQDGLDAAFWRDKLAEWRTSQGGAPLPNLIRQHLPHRLARWLCRTAGLDDGAAAATLRAEHRDRLIEHLGDFPARIVATEGWDKAMITRGGVDVAEVNPETLESRLAPGVFFAGEVLDIDGPCGGYNLHWAFASGGLAGKSAAEKA